MLAETRDAVPVAVEGTEKGLGEHPLEFGSVHSPHVLPGLLHRVLLRLVTAGHCGVKIGGSNSFEFFCL